MREERICGNGYYCRNVLWLMLHRLFELTLCAAVLGWPAAAQDARDIVLRSLEVDKHSEAIARQYTFIERSDQRILNSNGSLKKRTLRTHDLTLLEGSPYRRLIEKDDKPLPPDEEKKEQEKLRKSIEQRQKETEAQRARRIAGWERQRKKQRDLLTEIPDAYNLRLLPPEQLNGHDMYVIEAIPRPGYRPRLPDARFFQKIKGRIWISKDDYAWVKVEAEVLDTLSWGFVLARIQKGARMTFEQVRVNDEVWLPKSVTFRLGARVMLVSSIRAEVDLTFKNYRKFQSDSRITGYEPKSQ